MNNNDIHKNWAFRDAQEQEHRKQGMRGGIERRDDVDLRINYDLDRGRNIDEPYCQELLEVILTSACIEETDDMLTIINKLRNGLKTFSSASEHKISFFNQPLTDRVSVRVLEPRAGRKEGFISLPIYLTYKGKKVLVFVNSDREGLLRHLRQNNTTVKD